MRKLPVILFLGVALLICLYPFAWMFFSMFKTNREIYQPTLFFPAYYNWDGFLSLFSGSYIPFMDYFLNSILISGGQAFFAMFVTAGTGFVFAKYRFRGKSILFAVAILVILIPKQAMAVPLFDWMLWLGLQGSTWSLLLPGVASGLGVVFFTQVFRKIPDELLDLAKVEGYSMGRIFCILLPLVAPGLVTYGLLHFILSWQEHLLPLLLLDDQNLTLPIALAKLRDSSHRIPEAVGMAAGVLSLFPVVVLFGLCFRKMKTALVGLSLH